MDPTAQARKLIITYLGIAKRVLRYWYYGLILFVIVAAVAIFYAFRLPDMYTSTTKIMIAPALMRHLLERDGQSHGEELNWHNKFTNMFITRSRLTLVIQEFKLFEDVVQKGSKEDAIEEMYKYLEVFPIGEDLFSVSYRHEDPQKAKEIVSRLVDLFIEDNQKAKSGVAKTTTEVIDKRVAEVEKQLFDEEEKLKEFRDRYQSEINLIDARKVGAVRYDELNKQTKYEASNYNDPPSVRKLTSEKRDLEDELRMLRNQRENSPQETKAMEELRTLEQQLVDLKQRESSLLSRYTPEYPDVKAVRNQIREINGRIARYRSSIVKTQGTPQDRRISEILKNLDALDEQIAIERRRARDTNKNNPVQETTENNNNEEMTYGAIEVQYNRMLRSIESTRDMYQALLARKDTSQTLEEAEQVAGANEFRIIDQPNLPTKPSWPNRAKYIAAGTAGGLFLGLLLSIILGLLDNKLYTPLDLKSINGVTVLAIIPPFVNDKQKNLTNKQSTHKRRSG